MRRPTYPLTDDSRPGRGKHFARCASKPDLSSFEARLAFSQAFLEARLAALKAENPKLIAFYNSLDAKQKEKFDRFRDRHGRE